VEDPPPVVAEVEEETLGDIDGEGPEPSVPFTNWPCSFRGWGFFSGVAICKVDRPAVMAETSGEEDTTKDTTEVAAGVEGDPVALTNCPLAALAGVFGVEEAAGAAGAGAEAETEAEATGAGELDEAAEEDCEEEGRNLPSAPLG